MKDEQAADFTVPQMKEFLKDIALSSGAENIYLIGRSMGCLPLGRAFADLQKELGPRYMTRFRELIFITPDVNRNMFTEQILPALRTTGVKLTVFTSDRDKKLMESHQERAGLRLGDPLLGSFLKGVHFIDASAVDTSMVGKPYYVKKGTVYEDIKEIISAP